MSSSKKNGTCGFGSSQVQEFSLNAGLTSTKTNKQNCSSGSKDESSPEVQANQWGRFKRYNTNITEAMETDERDSSKQTEEEDREFDDLA